MASPFNTSSNTVMRPATEKGYRPSGGAGTEGSTHTVNATANSARTIMGTVDPEIAKNEAKKPEILQKGKISAERPPKVMGSKKFMPPRQARTCGISSTIC